MKKCILYYFDRLYRLDGWRDEKIDTYVDRERDRKIDEKKSVFFY